MNQAALLALLIGMALHSHPSAAIVESFIAAPRHHDRGSPPVGLPIKPGDWKRYPRSSFGFVYETGFGEKVDTFNGLVTKDMVIGRDTTISLRLSEAQLDTIYRAAIAIRLFEYPEPCPAQDRARPPSEPSTTIRLRATTGVATKELHWDSGLSPSTSTDEEWTRLYQFDDLIVRIVRTRPEWLALPRARGGYY